MNFDSIEGLNVDEIEELYSKNIENGSDDLISYDSWECWCHTVHTFNVSRCHANFLGVSNWCHVRCDEYLVYTVAACQRKCADMGCGTGGLNHIGNHNVQYGHGCKSYQRWADDTQVGNAGYWHWSARATCYHLLQR